jgi:hypothetical protein
MRRFSNDVRRHTAVMDDSKQIDETATAASMFSKQLT